MRSRLYIEGREVDLKDGEAPAITFQVADIQQPEKLKGSRSRTLKLPPTDNNNQVFGYLFDPRMEIQTDGGQFDPQFNPNRKANAVLTYGDRTVMRGFAQITEIDAERNYLLTLYSNEISLFDAIGDKELTDLGMGEWNHDYTAASQQESWATKIRRNGIPYVNFSGVDGSPNGYGYVYPLVRLGRSQSETTYAVNDLQPAIYANEYIRKIITQAGFTILSNFLATEYARRLIVPFTQKAINLSAAQVNSRTFLAESASNADYTYGPFNGTGVAGGRKVQLRKSYAVDFTVESGGSFFDGGDNFDGRTFVAPQAGIYAFETTVGVQTAWAGASVGSFFAGESNRININILRNGAQIGRTEDLLTSVNSNANYTCSVESVFLNVGDRVRVQVEVHQNARATGTFSPLHRIKAGSQFGNSASSATLVEGNPLDMNQCVPRGVKQRDFLRSYMTLHNLILAADKDNPRKLILEPLPDFYGTTEVVDWTDRVDASSKPEIVPSAQIEGRIYAFRYKEDRDHLNQTYRDTFQRGYGDREVTVQNDFVQGERPFEVIFAATPMAGNAYNDMVVPTILKRREDGTVEPIDNQIRILYYGGLKDVGPMQTWQHQSTSGTTLYDRYPYCGHLDDPYNSTVDLLFDLPREVYWGSAEASVSYTTANLYERYWRAYIEEVTDINSRLVTYRMHLKPSDISSLDPRKAVHVNGLNHRLNAIKDWRADRGGLCTVELARLKRSTAQIPSSTEIVPTPAEGVNWIDGGENEVFDPNQSTPFDRVDGGENVVWVPNTVKRIDGNG